jgi:hypothetical protein
MTIFLGLGILTNSKGYYLIIIDDVETDIFTCNFPHHHVPWHLVKKVLHHCFVTKMSMGLGKIAINIKIGRSKYLIV